MNREELAEIYDDELLFLDPPETFDPCIAGVAYRWCVGHVVVYDKDKVIERLVADGMEHEEAVEHFDFNVSGAYVGERTPMFLERLEC